MNDRDFIGKLNDLSLEGELVMPVLKEGDTPPQAFLERWTHFLETCVKKGIKLSDDRWQRLSIVSNDPVVRFDLGAPESKADEDFRIGLQLLVGMLGSDDTDD